MTSNMVPRLPRVVARDRKLDDREEALAEARGESKRVCKCSTCRAENHSRRSRALVQDYLKEYGRCPLFRGSTESFDHDDSDDEWDNVIMEVLGWFHLYDNVDGINLAST